MERGGRAGRFDEWPVCGRIWVIGPVGRGRAVFGLGLLGGERPHDGGGGHHPSTTRSISCCTPRVSIGGSEVGNNYAGLLPFTVHVRDNKVDLGEVKTLTAAGHMPRGRKMHKQ
eukprot:3701655-Pyramimonas_sp.AAC.1